eukprot:scaffold17308_cov13-Tisochrysis_lutea.AAC.1
MLDSIFCVELGMRMPVLAGVAQQRSHFIQPTAYHYSHKPHIGPLHFCWTRHAELRPSRDAAVAKQRHLLHPPAHLSQ